MSLRIFVDAASGQFERAMEEATETVKVASMGAANRAADIAKREARADIAAAGFGPRWQNTLRVNVFPRGGRLSTHPTVQVYHVIPYSGIFETGGPISGNPLLWLPLPDTPKRIGRQRVTPELFVRSVGPLIPIIRPGRRPLLAANISTNRSGQRGPGSPPVTLSALRRGARGGPKEAVPMFIGIDAVTLRDRFSVREIVEGVADRMPALFAAEFDP